MPKFLFAASYKPEGLEGVRKEGADARIRAIEGLVADLGGKVESFYFAFGDVDAFVTVDLPDDETAAAMTLAVGASGLVTTTTTKLLTGAQIDQAFAKSVPYRAPGA
ncbi:MAG: GYD domain-containing protein [Nocardioidaceae bacterium]|nr:GYD domain-containing protein [Nocardioidaceae bacterium]NUS50950.1 GYD domain-containing protein [Nocardioidaceae bacterium]